MGVCARVASRVACACVCCPVCWLCGGDQSLPEKDKKKKFKRCELMATRVLFGAVFF